MKPQINDWIAFTNGGTKPVLGIVIAVGIDQVAAEIYHSAHHCNEVVMVQFGQIREVRSKVAEEKGKKK